ncbi:surface antigen-like protein [Hypnocyclicus thermotrophus]|uniref:Surface antigen-like protein n=1 Tax=Hypnocyclicus thermotrophus TaxID=1627895 RepID=A0AA46DZI5_9FUSO|nr:BamA/TamA family outer membrane protein [Hypnocyclicus thermotrophus]TDT71837.1 surface antigen-like protein [Hypnocyclicus thermotrophus]
MKKINFFILYFILVNIILAKENFILPIVFYSPELGFAGGIIFKNLDKKETMLISNKISSFLTTNQYKSLNYNYNIKYFNNSRFNINLNYKDWLYDYYLNRKIIDDYNQKIIQIEINYNQKIIKKIYFKYGYNFSKIKINNNNFYLEKENINSSGINFALNYENILIEKNMKNGEKLEITTNIYNKKLLSDQDYIKNTFDYRKYFNIKNNQIRAQIMIKDINGEVPFYLKYDLGSNTLIRGFTENKYLGNTFIGGQIEFEKNFNKRFTGVLFYGTGDTNDNFDNIDILNLKSAIGLGIKYIISEDFKVRMDMGFASDGDKNMYINFSDAI